MMTQICSQPLLSTKRSRPHHISQPLKKHLRTEPLSTHHFDELRSLLLKKIGYESDTMGKAQANDLLITGYSPRLVHLLDTISETLVKNEMDLVEHGEIDKYSAGSVSDLTQSSDDEQDAVVPSFEPLMSERVAKKQQSKLSIASLESARKIPVPIEEDKTEKVIIKSQPLSKNEKVQSELTSYKSETEIAISRIFDLGKVAAVEDPSIAAEDPYDGPSVITMTGFGELGRYGNQILQYIFLKSYAVRHNIKEIQVPGWVGAGLFGLQDSKVKRALPATVEFRDTLANSTFTTDFIDYVKNSNSKSGAVELFPEVLGENNEASQNAPKNVDIWGWFQWNTSHFAPFKSHILKTFAPVPELFNPMHAVFEKNLRYRDGKKRTVVGLHLRLGDYKNIAASSFGYVAPTSWYLTWLEKIWPTLENPVLFVASDDVEAVLRDFSKYNPLTSDSIGLTVPESMSKLKAGFFPDWFSLTQCDILAISNSTFSFTASMMNQRPDAKFFRAHYQGFMEKIDPWNADPIVHRDMNKAGLHAALETLQIVYNTQGSRGLAKNIFYELPYYGLRSAMMKAILWHQSRSPQPVSVEA